MKKLNVRLFVPHLIAVVIFLIVAVLFCRPALEGKVLQQTDISQWQGSIRNSEEYAKTHNGRYPLWSNGPFSGMPAFQIGGVGNNMIATAVHTVLTLGLPKPMQFFFLACICFYILCMTLRLNPYAAIMGALAFAYATYNPVIVAVGHDTKMLAIAYMPAVLSGVLLLYQRKYLLGALLTALFTSAMIAMNHVQIVYYLAIAIAIMTVVFLVQWIREKAYKHIAIACSLAIVAAATGVASNAEILMSTFEYQKYTIRGGGSVLTDTTKNKPVNKSVDGLDKDYALAYSLNITEPLVMMVPRMFGGSSDNQEVSDDKSKAIEALSALPRELQNQMPLAFYWGGIKDVGGNTGTSGPPYIGAFVCFLAILSFFVKANRHRWWILGAMAVTIAMSWGIYFESFNGLLYKYLPLYNKFRAPSMVMVIPQLLMPLAAVLFTDYLIQQKESNSLMAILRKGAITGGAIIALLLLLYFSFDYYSTGDRNMLRQVREMNQPQLLEYVQSFFTGLIEDRKSLLLSDIFRTLVYMALAGAMVWIVIKNWLKPTLAMGIFAAIALLDVMLINTTYLNSENYKEKEENQASFAPTKADNEILMDKTDYRVFNVAGNRFNENNTAYFYKSVGGYHPAKLRVYQDLIEHQLGKPELNMPVLNMLNTKYLIQKDGAGNTQQYQPNPGALGSCWLVKQVVFVKNADAEMKALDNFNPRDTAFVQESYKASITSMPQADSMASIKLIKNDNDLITYQFEAGTPQFAVFSEIYYPAGWKAYIDEKEAPIVKTNYVLRGLAVPAGKHAIKFVFDPEGHRKGKQLGLVGLILTLAFAALWAIFSLRKGKTPTVATDKI
jgi:hypothetical protein